MGRKLVAVEGSSKQGDVVDKWETATIRVVRSGNPACCVVVPTISYVRQSMKYSTKQSPTSARFKDTRDLRHLIRDVELVSRPAVTHNDILVGPRANANMCKTNQ